MQDLCVLMHFKCNVSSELTLQVTLESYISDLWEMISVRSHTRAFSFKTEFEGESICFPSFRSKHKFGYLVE